MSYLQSTKCPGNEVRNLLPMLPLSRLSHRRPKMVTAAHRMMPPLDYVRLHDAAAGLDGVIALHSTARRPAAGGCRIRAYTDASAAMGRVLRLADSHE